jgi:hypothetical protein
VVASEGGGNKLLVDAGSRRKDPKTNQFFTIDGKSATDIYSNFLLQQVTEERMEKQQILETFGEAYIFLFGQRARVITFQGILANTFDFNWEAEWWYNYDTYLRGTKCVENDARVYISYDNTLVGGYILGTSSAKDSMNKNHVTFQFQLFVTYYSNFSAIGDPSAFPGDGVRASHQFVNDSLSQEELAQYRPDLITDIPLQAGPLLVTQPGGLKLWNGQTNSLFESLETGVAQAKDAWNQTQQVVNSAMDYAAGFFDPAGVRIPIGFAGSMVFKDDQRNVVTPNESSGVTRYTSFDDNDDEFVGVGDHYGPRIFKMNFGATTAGQEIEYGQEMVRKASYAWAKAGFKIPDTSLGPVSKFLVSKSVGLLGVGATEVWKVANTATQAGAADPAHFADSNLDHAASAVDTTDLVVKRIE